MTDRRVVVHLDAARVAEDVADRFVATMTQLLAERDRVEICVTGGSTGIAVLAAIARHPELGRLDWSRVGVWFSDERYLPLGHPDRNDRQAREALLDRVPLPSANLHPFPAVGAHAGIDEAAAAFAVEFGSTRFDLVLLGVGPDGHVGSLFPDRPTVLETDRTVVAETASPKPPAERLSFTLPVFNAAERVWLVLAGADKAGALGLALADAQVASVPVAGVHGRLATEFFVDRAAAAEVPDGLIDTATYWTAGDE